MEFKTAEDQYIAMRSPNPPYEQSLFYLFLSREETRKADCEKRSHKHAKTEVGQYLAIFTSRLINNRHQCCFQDIQFYPFLHGWEGKLRLPPDQLTYVLLGWKSDKLQHELLSLCSAVIGIFYQEFILLRSIEKMHDPIVS